MPDSDRILAIHKKTGISGPIIQSSRPLLRVGLASPWNYVKVEEFEFDPIPSFTEIIFHEPCIGLVTECESRIRVVERLPYSKMTTDFATGDFDFHPMGPRAPFKIVHGAKVFVASLKQELFISAAEEAGINGNDLEPIKLSNDAIITSAMFSLRYELLQDFPGGAVRGDTIASVIANRIIALNEPQKANAHIPRGGLSSVGLKLATDFIKSNFQSDVTLDELSAVVHMSPYHFCRMFKQSTGLSPYQYVIQCRMEHAKELLSTGKLSIKQVARAVGFYDQSHFTRHFKRCTGISPTAYLDSQISPPRIEPDELV